MGDLRTWNPYALHVEDYIVDENGLIDSDTEETLLRINVEVDDE